MTDNWSQQLMLDDLAFESGRPMSGACQHGRRLHERCPFCNPLPPAQRHSQTSRDAASAIEPSANTLREQVFARIVADGPLTDEAGCEATGMNPSTWRPRRIELFRAGRIKPVGTAKTKSLRSAVTWEAT